MAKRSKKEKSVKKKNKNESSSEIKYLEKLMQISVDAADGKSEQLDLLFTNQANKIRIRIDKLKENQ